MIEQQETPELLINTFLSEGLYRVKPPPQYTESKYTLPAAVKRMRNGYLVSKHRYSKPEVRTLQISLSKCHQFIVMHKRDSTKKLKVDSVLGITFGASTSTFVKHKTTKWEEWECFSIITLWRTFDFSTKNMSNLLDILISVSYLSYSSSKR